MIDHYLRRLARELEFDPALARRVEREVEDHLREAVGSDPAADRLEAEQRAVARFGDPRTLAAQFALVSLSALTRRVGLGAMLLIGAVFIACAGLLVSRLGAIARRAKLTARLSP